MASGNSYQPLMLLGLAAGAFALYNQTRNKVTAHEYGNLRLAFTGAHLEDQDVILTVNLQNPNPEPMSVKSFIGTMYANGKQVAAVKMFSDYTARDNGEVTMSLIAKPVTANLLANLRTAMGHPLKLSLTGTININNHALPVNLQLTK